VPIRQDKAIAADALADIARAAGIPAMDRNSIEAALAAVAGLELEAPPRVLVTGSLYLAGEVLAANGTPPT
jgi:dihydrofolate synthase/folylpolyglutamate synthase